MRDNLRNALTWPLYSTRRLLITVAALIGALVLVSLVTGRHPAPSDEKGTRGSPSPSVSSSHRPSPTPSVSPDLNAALDTGRDFVNAWADNKKSRRDWFIGISPFVTETLAEKLVATDPRNIDATEARKAKNTDTGGDNLTEVAVSTDAGLVSVRLVWNGTRWWVYGIEPGAQAVEK